MDDSQMTDWRARPIDDGEPDSFAAVQLPKRLFTFEV